MSSQATHRLLCSLLILAIYLVCHSASVALAQSAAPVLEPGKSIEREIAGGETHSYPIMLDSGQYVSATIDQIGIDVSVKIIGPGHQQLAEVDDWKLIGRVELIVFGTNSAGKYFLEVSPVNRNANAGRYELKIKLLSPATQEDKTRITADQLFVEGGRLRSQNTTDSRRQAIEKYRGAVSLSAALGDQAQEADAFLEIGFIYGEQREPRLAVEANEQSLLLARAIADSRRQARALDSIGMFSRVLGEQQKALESYDQALALQRASGDRRKEALTLNLVGEFYFYVSDQQKAQDYFQQALQINKALGDIRGEHEDLLNLGISYRALGEPQNALEYYNKANQLLPPPLEGGVLHSIGTIYYDLGEQDKALEYLGEALKIRLASADPAAPFTENAIGIVYRALGEPQKALEYHNRALVGMCASGDRQGEGVTLLSLGSVYAQLHEQHKALEYFGQALPILRAVSDRRNEAVTLSNMGEVQRSLGALPKAVEYFDQALSLQQSIRDRIGAATTLYGIARAELALGQLERARERIERVLESVESMRIKIGNAELRASYLASKQQYYEFYVNLLMRMEQRDPGNAYASLALTANERARARGLLDVLTEARTDIRMGVDAKLLDRESKLQQELNLKSEQLTRLLSRKPDEAAAAKQEVESLLNAYQEVEAQIRSASPRYAALTQPAPLNLKKIQSEVLDDQTLLLEYSLGEEKSFLWVVTVNSIKSFELPKRATIEAAARSVYARLTARNSTLPTETPGQKQVRILRLEADYPRAAAALSEMILAPVASELGTKRMLVVSDGALQYVPLGALPTPRDEKGNSLHLSSVIAHPLIVDHEIISLPSASVLAALRLEASNRKPAMKAVAVLADPVFSRDDPRFLHAATGRHGEGSKASDLNSSQLLAPVLRSAEESGLKDFARLHFSRAEADAITRLAPEGQGLEAVDFLANRTTATSADLGQYRIVHFATHGLINSQHPELSGIVLSLVDQKGQPQNGFLRLYEIYNLKLNADLVVLSACQTALGKEIKGEGLIGLTRGFMYAGAPRVVASLWRIDDRATAELMTRFYRGMITEGLTAAAALRAAQISMWQEKRWSAPPYWAAFTIQGEWK